MVVKASPIAPGDKDGGGVPVTTAIPVLALAGADVSANIRIKHWSPIFMRPLSVLADERKQRSQQGNRDSGVD
jgi:hypothetical protein